MTKSVRKQTHLKRPAVGAVAIAAADVDGFIILRNRTPRQPGNAT